MSKAIVLAGETALEIEKHKIRRDGDMWCMTDLWRAAGAPKDRRPAEFIRSTGKSFIDFLRASLDMGNSHIVKTRKIGGSAPGGETWGHYHVALAYAQWIDHAFHARVNEVYRAFTAGLLAPRERLHPDQEELIRYKLRLAAQEAGEYESVWSLELKLELARLRKLAWDGRGLEPRPLAFAYGRTWRIILGDAVYDELKRRNPHPKSGSLHGQWLQAEALRIAGREDLVIALVLARRAVRWGEYEHEMRAHFRRAPLQLRLVKGGAA